MKIKKIITPFLSNVSIPILVFHPDGSAFVPEGYKVYATHSIQLTQCYAGADISHIDSKTLYEYSIYYRDDIRIAELKFQLSDQTTFEDKDTGTVMCNPLIHGYKNWDSFLTHMLEEVGPPIDMDSVKSAILNSPSFIIQSFGKSLDFRSESFQLLLDQHTNIMSKVDTISHGFAGDKRRLYALSSNFAKDLRLKSTEIYLSIPDTIKILDATIADIEVDPDNMEVVNIIKQGESISVELAIKQQDESVSDESQEKREFDSETSEWQKSHMYRVIPCQIKRRD